MAASPTPAPRTLLALAGILVLAAAVALVILNEPRDGADARSASARHAGSATCARCHTEEHARWQDSHHDLAMQEARPATVLGDFDDARFTHFGVTSTFRREGDRFLVRTDGPDGELADFEIAYTFGVEPLQQYLIERRGGRLQALGICWDSRPVSEGGQRWFHLHPDEAIPHDDPLHWTAHAQTWNHQCAACHSTGLRRGYDPDTDRYETTWKEIDVACEACHGPGSRHVAWAEAGAEGEDPRLAVRFPKPGAWTWAEGATTAHREPARPAPTEVETCARCHSRRTRMSEDPPDGGPVLDTHRVALLENGLYGPDGQIRAEVYVYGSFLQSRMFHAGVTCSDCHEPHGLGLRAPGNALCTRCHQAAAYDTPDHHHHEPGSGGAACVTCHMPERTYMVVDPRRDHGLRVPRPDLSVELGTPNACTGCHDDRPAQWAVEVVAGWYGEEEPPPHFAHVLHAGRAGHPGAGARLAALAGDGAQPPIVRATALRRLGILDRGLPEETVAAALGHQDPILRFGAATALEGADARQRLALATRVLDDPVRAVRIEAARLLAPFADEDLPEDRLDDFRRALEDYRAFQELNADQPWAHVNLGLLHRDRGRPAHAEEAYRRALALDPAAVPARINLADLLREQDRDDEGGQVLRTGLGHAPDSPELAHSLGLLLVRRGRKEEALHWLGRAARGRPEDPRYGYVHGVALWETGSRDQALDVLARTHRRHPRDRHVLAALASYHRERGDRAAARRYERALDDLRGQDGR